MKIQKKEAKGAKSNMAAHAGIITYIISLGIRIPLTRAIGDTGIGLFAPAFELFFLITLLFSYGISRTMTGLIRYRMKRSQYKNASNVFHVAFKVSVIISVVTAFILVVASGSLSGILVLEPMSRKAIITVAPVVVLAALVNVFRGYFNGNGFGILVVHSQYIEKISMLIAAVIGGRIYYAYGLKIAALLLSDMAAYAYAAQGVMLGIMVSQIITLIYLLFVFGMYASAWKRQLSQDGGKRMESSGEIMGMLLGNGIPVMLVAILSNVFMLIDQRFFNYCMNLKGAGDIRTQSWGSYYSKFATLTGIGAALVCLAVHGSVGKTVVAYDREDYHSLHDRIGGAVKKLCVVAFPIAINLAVLAEAFVKALYPGENELAVSILQRGTVIILFFGIVYLFGQYMLRMRMTKELLFSLTVSLAAHLLAVFLFVGKGLLGAEGVVYSVILFSLILAVLCFVFTAKKVGYRQEWLYAVAFPAVSACVCGLLVMLLNKLLLHLVGSILTILISCLLSTIAYMLLLMFLHVFNNSELEELPFGGIWIALGRMIGIL